MVIFSIIDPKISAEIGIIQGTIIFIYKFSSNSRVILLNENDDRNFENFVFFREVYLFYNFCVSITFLKILNLLKKIFI